MKNGEEEVKTITCPACEREWPHISEQGVVADMVGKCYACFIREVVVERDQRMKAASYKVENCSSCTGISGAREKCTICFGRGWVKASGEGLIQLVR